MHLITMARRSGLQPNWNVQIYFQPRLEARRAHREAETRLKSNSILLRNWCDTRLYSYSFDFSSWTVRVLTKGVGFLLFFYSLQIEAFSIFRHLGTCVPRKPYSYLYIPVTFSFPAVFSLPKKTPFSFVHVTPYTHKNFGS